MHDGAELDWSQEKNAALATFLERFYDAFAEQVGQVMADLFLETGHKEIRSGIFDTAGGGVAHALIDTGKYDKSLIKGNELIKRDGYDIHVGSTDPKALDLEYGTTPEELPTDIDRRIFEWGTRKGLSLSEINRITDLIKEEGNVAKPVIRRAYQTVKYNGKPRIISRVGKNIKKVLRSQIFREEKRTAKK